MKVTAFSGSSRSKKGNTHIMAEEFLAGAREAGAETEIITLAEKKINRCLACFRCWTQTPGQCIQTDAMPSLLKTFMAHVHFL